MGDLARIGLALSARADDVLTRAVALTHQQSGGARDALAGESFEMTCMIATIAVVQGMSGEDPDLGDGREAWSVFAGLVSRHAMPLNEVTERCLHWRDAAGEVVRECASELGASKQALDEALELLQKTLDSTLVRLCEVFESERRQAGDELARRQNELAFIATHDPLTGLPNRSLLLDRGEQMLGRARRKQTPVAALLINLDNFKGINETLGHDAGDELLQAVTARLDGFVRETDVLGRIGGDEFIVLAEEVSVAGGPKLIAERLLAALKEPFELIGEHKARLTVTASIGVALTERASAADLLRDADIAMYRAKWDGKNRYMLFEAGMQDAVQNNVELEMDLREALARKEFFLVYQPTLDLRDMSPTGMEALLRWRSPSRGVVQPNDFIPVLEDTGLVTEVGRWVLQEACRQVMAWRGAGHTIGMAVNVSARQLDTDELVHDVRDALAASGLEPGVLTIEITETTLMRNVDETARRLAIIKELGVRIAIDDFGTGYSSLAHLQRFPVDALKIDRSFISRLTENPEGETLIHTLVELGKALSIETLAEGIEQHEELSMLQQERCDSGQGFLFAKPLDPAAAYSFLQSWAYAGATAPHSAPAGA